MISTVKYLKEKYEEGKDYGYITVVARKRMVEVQSPTAQMMAELVEMGFEDGLYTAIKVWPAEEVSPVAQVEAPKLSQEEIEYLINR